MKKKRIISFIAIMVLCLAMLVPSGLIAFAEGEDAPQPAPVAEDAQVLAEPAENEDVDNEGIPQYTVKFVDWNGAVLSTQKIAAGGTAEAPANPHRDGHSFLGWDTDYTNVETDLTVTAMYRALNSYTIAIRYIFSDGTIAAQPFVATVAEGFALNKEVLSPEVTGYIASEAKVVLNYEAVTSSQTITVTYTPATGVPYTVVHRQQNADGNGYTEVERATYYGVTGAVVQASSKNYTGFSTPSILPSATIASNGSTVLVVNYDRITTVLYFDVAGGSYVEPYVGRYGSAVAFADEPERLGYTFLGWDKTIPATMPATDTYYVAKWQKNSTATYSIYYWLEKPLRGVKEYEYLHGETLTGNVDEAPPIPADTLHKSYFPDVAGFSRTNFFAQNVEKTIAANAGTVIQPDGSTVVNVYIDRVVHTFIFAIDSNYYEDDIRIAHNGTYYKSGEYSIDVKYGENIRDIFPDIAVQVDDEGNFVQELDPGYIDGYVVTPSTLGTLFMPPYKRDTMPAVAIGNNKTLTLRMRSSSTYQYEVSVKVMLEDIGGGTYSETEPRIFYVNKQTNLLASGIAGFGTSVPSQVSSADTEENRVFNYPRLQYNIGFYSENVQVKLETGIWYEQEIESYYFEPTAPAGKKDYTFAGWYTTSQCIDGTEFDFAGQVMPSKQLSVYAKWVPPVFTVKMDPLNGGNIITQQVSKNGLINVPQNPVKEGYVFMGWREASRDVQYMLSNPVIRDLNLVAIWVPDAIASYKISYKHNGADLLQPATVDGVRIGDTVTAHAREIKGYLPDAVSKSLLILPEDNEVVFVYTPFITVNYTVRYQDVDGRNLLPEENYTTTNTYVTHTYKKVAGYTPIETQMTIMLTSDPTQNIITFIYVTDEQAPYRIEHYLQNTSGVNYYLANSYTNAAYVGNQVTASSRSYMGFAYNSAKSTTKGVVTRDGKLVLKLYYDRTMVNVFFMAGEHGSLEGIQFYGDIRYGTLFKDAATVPTPVPEQGYMFGGWTPALLGENDLVTQNLFYTANFVPDPNATISVRYHANGGTGTMRADENLHVGDSYTVRENEFNREGYVFQGWQTAPEGGSYYKAGAQTTLTGGMDLYARWGTDDMPVVNPNPEDPDASDYEALNQQTLQELKDAGVPTIQIGNTEIPLYGFGKPVWALLNLLFALGSVAMGIGSIVSWRRRKDDDMADGKDAEGKKQRKLFTWMRIAIIVLAVLAPLVFLATQNMHYLMVFVDGWTILMLAMFVAQLVGVLFFRGKRKEKEPEEEVGTVPHSAS